MWLHLVLLLNDPSVALDVAPRTRDLWLRYETPAQCNAALNWWLDNPDASPPALHDQRWKVFLETCHSRRREASS